VKISENSWVFYLTIYYTHGHEKYVSENSKKGVSFSVQEERRDKFKGIWHHPSISLTSLSRQSFVGFKISAT
jgi:hypothetical protein